MSATISRGGLRHASELLASRIARDGDRPNSIMLSSSLTARYQLASRSQTLSLIHISEPTRPY